MRVSGQKFGTVFNHVTDDDQSNKNKTTDEIQGEMGRGKFGTVYHVVGRKDGISYASKHVKYRYCKPKILWTLITTWT